MDLRIFSLVKHWFTREKKVRKSIFLVKTSVWKIDIYLSKGISCTPWRNTPSTSVIRIRPVNNFCFREIENLKKNLKKKLKKIITHHKRSHIGPSWGTSCNRSNALIWSNVSMLGLSPVNNFFSWNWKFERKKNSWNWKILNTLPPWRQKICPSTSAVKGR